MVVGNTAWVLLESKATVKTFGLCNGSCKPCHTLVTYAYCLGDVGGHVGRDSAVPMALPDFCSTGGVCSSTLVLHPLCEGSQPWDATDYLLLLQLGFECCCQYDSEFLAAC